MLRPLGDRARRSPRYQWWVLWVSLSGLLATNLLFTVFVVALPEVSRSLHASVGATTWVVTGPLLAYGVVAPLVGKAGDLFGHRRLFMAGIMAETVAAATSALAPNIGVLIAARVLGGMVGASIGAASMALVLSVFDHHDRVKALGFWSLVGAGGPVIGVALGGPVIQHFGWRWMFFLQVPLLLAAAVLALTVLPQRATGRRHVTWDELDLDWAGAGSIAACVAAFLLALTFLPSFGGSSPLVLGLLGVSVVSGIAFRAAGASRLGAHLPARLSAQEELRFPDRGAELRQLRLSRRVLPHPAPARVLLRVPPQPVRGGLLVVAPSHRVLRHRALRRVPGRARRRADPGRGGDDGRGPVHGGVRAGGAFHRARPGGDRVGPVGDGAGRGVSVAVGHGLQRVRPRGPRHRRRVHSNS